MKKELTVQTIIDANIILKKASLGKMKDGENFQVVKALRAIKAAATPAQELIDAANDKLKPESYDKVMEWMNHFSTLTDDQKIEANNIINNYNNKVARCTMEEMKKTVKIDISPLSEESFGRLVESNDFTVGQIMVLQDVLCK